jgi:tetratricopeptide (TPR) repeat protein
MEDERNVIPRWRSPAVLSSWEISSPRVVPGETVTIERFADDLKLWREEGSIAAAVDIYDTGILLNDKSLQLEGAGPILRQAKDVPASLIESVRRSLASPPDLGERHMIMARHEQSRKYLASTVRMLKQRINESSRDIVSLLEIARLQAILGQPRSAERYIRQALAIAPNNRMVLRAAVQFYRIAGDVGQILPALWRSDGIKFDPLIQSAEIAAADLAQRGSKAAKSAVRSLKGLSEVGIIRSELALAVATLEMNSGVAQRQVFRLVRAGLPHGTENAVAQAVWLGDRTARTLQSRFPDLKLADDAYEAKTLTSFDQEDYAQAVIEAKNWLLDQPFQAAPLAHICTSHAIYLLTPQEAIPYAERGVQLHSHDWTVLNAAFLVFLRSGIFDRAKSTLAQLEKVANTAQIRAFAAAGAGMLAFAHHDVFAGRRNYELAIQESKRARRPDMVFSAFIFYLLGEISAGCMDRAATEDMFIKVDALIKKVPADNHDYCARLWRALKIQMSDCVLAVENQRDAMTDVRPALISAEVLERSLEFTF